MVQVVGIGKNTIETQVVEHFVVIMMIGIIHQKDEAALLGRNKRRWVLPAEKVKSLWNQALRRIGRKLKSAGKISMKDWKIKIYKI